MSRLSDGVKSELLLHVSLRHVPKCCLVVLQQLEDGGQLLALHPWWRDDETIHQVGVTTLTWLSVSLGYV